MTREEWLQRGVERLRTRFTDAGHPLPTTIHVSIGFPSRGALKGTRRTVVGQCWGSKDGNDASADKAPHIFISPLHDSGVKVLDTLAHELAHAASPKGAKHGAKFVRVCNAVGLTNGKPTHVCAGPELLAELERLNADLGTFPHAALDASAMPKGQTTRLLKVCCPECDYTVRVTRAWLDQGAPICPLDNISMEES
jgi:hypothetical protein